MHILDNRNTVPQTKPVEAKAENLFDENNVVYRVLGLFCLHTVVFFKHLEELGLDKQRSIQVLMLLADERLLNTCRLTPDMIPDSPSDFHLSKKGEDLYLGVKRLKYVSKQIEKPVSA